MIKRKSICDIFIKNKIIPEKILCKYTKDSLFIHSLFIINCYHNNSSKEQSYDVVMLSLIHILGQDGDTQAVQEDAADEDAPVIESVRIDERDVNNAESLQEKISKSIRDIFCCR